MADTSAGKDFEADLRSSCKENGILYHRIKDVFIPPNLRHLIPVSENPFDCFLYFYPNLLCLELKSTNRASLPFTNIKEHQLVELQEYSDHKGSICGLLINFRGLSADGNRTFFVEISEFMKYYNIAKFGMKGKYKNKVNKSSISIAICEEIGIEIEAKLKRVHYRYLIKEFIQEAIKRYGKQ